MGSGDVFTANLVPAPAETIAPVADAQWLVDDGLVTLEKSRITVTPRGRLFVRNACMAFDAYLKKGPRLFSRTV